MFVRRELIKISEQTIDTAKLNDLGTNGQTIIGAQIHSGNEAETTSNPSNLIFSTKSGASPYNLTEAMRINSLQYVGINNTNPNFYASSIVGGIIPMALGTAAGLKRLNSSRRVWCFIGDMTMETGVFWEAYKYSQNYNLPIQFVVEDNNLSVHTPTDIAWGKRMEVPKNVIYYQYEMSYPHHGTGKWVNF